MARTYLELQAEALHDDFDPIKYRTYVKRWINDALRKIARRSNIPELQGLTQLTLVAGTAAYGLPADSLRVVSVFDATVGEDRGPLEETTQVDIDALPVASGTPFAFAVHAGKIVLYPTPDRSTYQLFVRYLRNAAELVNDTDTVVASMPDDYVDLLVTYARSRLYRAEDDQATAAALKAEFEDELGRMRADVQHPSRRRKRTGGMFTGSGAVPAFRRP